MENEPVPAINQLYQQVRLQPHCFIWCATKIAERPFNAEGISVAPRYNFTLVQTDF